MNTFVDFKNCNEEVLQVYYKQDEESEFPEFIIMTENNTFKFTAEGDCCSVSYFRFYKEKTFDILNGKVIKTIKEINLPDDYEIEEDLTENQFTLNDYITPHLYEITFKDDDNSKFEFLMYNYSNGYYDGWISSKVFK